MEKGGWGILERAQVHSPWGEGLDGAAEGWHLRKAVVPALVQAPASLGLCGRAMAAPEGS